MLLNALAAFCATLTRFVGEDVGWPDSSAMLRKGPEAINEDASVCARAMSRRCEKQSFRAGDEQTSSFERHLVSCVDSDGGRVGGGSSSSLSELDNKNHQQGMYVSNIVLVL